MSVPLKIEHWLVITVFDAFQGEQLIDSSCYYRWDKAIFDEHSDQQCQNAAYSSAYIAYDWFNWAYRLVIQSFSYSMGLKKGI